MHSQHTQATAQFEAGLSAAAPVVGDRLEEAGQALTEVGQHAAEQVKVCVCGCECHTRTLWRNTVLCMCVVTCVCVTLAG
jgi:hypothetical protein